MFGKNYEEMRKSEAIYGAYVSNYSAIPSEIKPIIASDKMISHILKASNLNLNSIVKFIKGTYPKNFGIVSGTIEKLSENHL
ncbi:hypothetical protein AYI68_g3177 [Smittium mucronatum]|uniref:Uncharacterized protein n=1 Tax=Smittium mucronatum TaxID=133383 RepID=A0A1R0H0M0_9FUNG|nr:hypothetical protein AYI68_g3177 [Smittium mucronatum]